MAKGKKTGGRDFKPGQSGNPGGRPKTKVFSEAIKKALGDPEDSQSRISQIINALLQAAESGNVMAVRELMDRIDGKPTQSIEHAGTIEHGSIKFTKRDD